MLSESRAWSLFVLLAAWVSFPFVFSFCVAAAAWHRLTGRRELPKTPTGPQRTAIVTGGKMTKALVVCRHLKAAGCRVVLVETHKYWMVASRFASCVDRFITVPVPEKEPDEYRQAIKVLAYEEDADLFVPVCSPVASFYDSGIQSVLPPGCRSLSLGQATTVALDDKVTFAELAKGCGLPVPDTRRMRSKEDMIALNDELRAKGAAATRFVLKNLAYDSMRRLDLFTVPCEPAKLAEYTADIEVTPATPWVAQAFVEGTEYSTCAIAHEGSLALFTDNQASISCFNYEYQADPRLRHWVETFVRAHTLTGILCIDFFIEDKTGLPLAIECNPRFSSNITNFYNSPTAWRAFTQPDELARKGEVETPMPSAVESNWIFVDLYYALRKPGLTLAERVRQAYDALFHKKDAYFEPSDVLPFLALHYLHIPVLLARNVWRGNKWAKIDMCIGKLTEENGD